MKSLKDVSGQKTSDGKKLSVYTSTQEKYLCVKWKMEKMILNWKDN